MGKRDGDEVFTDPKVGDEFWYDGGDYFCDYTIVHLTSANVYYEGISGDGYAELRLDFAKRAKHTDYHGRTEAERLKAKERAAVEGQKALESWLS